MGFKTDDPELPLFIRELILKRSWQSVMAPAVEMVALMVKEFYAAIHPEGQYSGVVRGVVVEFNKKEINHRGARGNVIIKNPSEAHLEEALHIVGKPNSAWTILKIGVYTLRPADIIEEDVIWFYMVKNRIMSTSHDTTIQRDQVMLVYCMMKGFDLTYGQLIRDQIMACAQRKRGKLFFPSLITSLCMTAGVEIEPAK